MTTVDKIHPVALRPAGSKAVSSAAEAAMVEAAMVESAIKREEDQQMDEELTSDDEDCPVKASEDHMMQVAIAESVKHTRTPVKAHRLSDGSPRYGPRKRRRPSESQHQPDAAAAGEVGNPSNSAGKPSSGLAPANPEEAGSSAVPPNAPSQQQQAPQTSHVAPASNTIKQPTSNIPPVPAIAAALPIASAPPPSKAPPIAAPLPIAAAIPMPAAKPPVPTPAPGGGRQQTGAQQNQLILPSRPDPLRISLMVARPVTTQPTKPPPIPIVPAPPPPPVTVMPRAILPMRVMPSQVAPNPPPKPIVPVQPRQQVPVQARHVPIGIRHSVSVARVGMVAAATAITRTAAPSQAMVATPASLPARQRPPLQARPSVVPSTAAPLSVVPRHLLQHAKQGQHMGLKSNLLPSMGSVPNPLSKPIAPTSLLLPAPAQPRTLPVKSSDAAVPCPLTNPVPCPLPHAPFKVQSELPPFAPQPPPPVFAQAPLAPAKVEKRVTIAEPEVPFSSAPAPLVVSSSAPPAPAGRARVFSVDIDPATFDFSTMTAESSSVSVKTETLEDLTAPASDASILQRDRGYSFEFFNFPSDELLPASPALPASSSELPDPTRADEPTSFTRPRGDSIIFDPISFQEGGIHEKNALMKPRASALAPTPAQIVSAEPNFSTANTGITATSLPQPVAPLSAPPRRAPVSYNAVVTPTSSNVSSQMATLPSSLNASTAAGTAPATFQMDLLNKGGRIGIYLPEARKARIARFHAKRKMRIWRKRIKYDCRKKLADSRPRIKGRFVKRSDMEEES